MIHKINIQSKENIKEFGLKICYNLITNPKTSLISLNIESDREIGNPPKWRYYGNYTCVIKDFDNIDKFLEMCKEKGLKHWNMAFMYENVVIKVNGDDICKELEIDSAINLPASFDGFIQEIIEVL